VCWTTIRWPPARRTWRWPIATLALPEAQAPAWPEADPTPAGPCSRAFAVCAPRLGWTTLDLDGPQLDTLFGSTRRHAETDAGTLLSFFHGDRRTWCCAPRSSACMRPHGHILCSGLHLVPDETALTSTVWMAGVFHSMVTQGHVSINRFLTTVRGMLGQFRAQGQRVFVRADGAWCQLGVPSAFEIEPSGLPLAVPPCRTACCRCVPRCAMHRTS
jgi:hypothetical protein